MVARVYDCNQLSCSCLLEDSDWGLLALEVMNISRSGGLLDTQLLFPRSSQYEAILKLTAGPSRVLQAEVVSSGSEGLRVRWRHSSRADAEEFDQLLASCAAPRNGDGRVHGEDGALDINATLLSRTKTVRSDDLAARRRTVRVLQMSTVTELIQEAVGDAVSQLGRRLDRRDRDQLLQEAEEIFADRLAMLKSENADLSTRANTLTEQLDKAQHTLEEERNRVIDSQRFTVSDQGIVVLEQRLGRLVDRAVRDGSISSSMETEMRAVVARLLDEERERISEQARGAHSDSIDLLERKVQRLARSLAEAESERDRARRRAAQLEVHSAALGNIMEPGISADDAQRELKLSLLEDLVRDNHQLRDQIKNRESQ